MAPVPHFPTDESDDKGAPDIGDMVDRILNRGDGSTLTSQDA
ncbi:hypothetical protein [Haladaptatus halobius]|nr:hypothetical protein [Haladaptatus halobius]